MNRALGVGVVVAAIAVFSSLNASADTKDEAAIKTIVESVGTLADTGNFNALEALYAPEIEVDYTSLSGGEAEFKNPRTLMTEWACVLPGFDLTRHEVSNIRVSSNGGTATARSNVVAYHWVGDLFWKVKGDYVYGLAKNGDRWFINAHQFNLKEEDGTRDVFGPAIENAAADPADYIKHLQTEQGASNPCRI